MIPTLPYNEVESLVAYHEWQAMCGHHSIAAATGKSLDAVKAACPKLCGWMSPTMVTQTLQALKTPAIFRQTSAMDSQHRNPTFFKPPADVLRIIRIQWVGSWLNAGVPAAAAYKRTHYIACLQGHIMDTMRDANVLLTYEQWLALQHEHVAQIKGATGYYFTHFWQLQRDS